MEVIEHHLVVCPHARPIKQKVRKQALERQQFIAEEIKNLEAAGLVRGVVHPTWLANLVVVGKANGKWRLCIDFTDLNTVKPEMIKEATQNARKAAMQFAADSESSLGKIKSASQGQFSIDDRDQNTPYIKEVRVVTTIEYMLED